MAAGVLVFPSVKQVRVRTCAEQEEHELLTVHAIDQKPIGTDVTFTKADVITGEIVIAVLSGRGCCAASWSTMDSSRLRSQPRLAASLRSFLKRLERTTSSIGQYLVHSIVKGCVTGVIFGVCLHGGVFVQGSCGLRIGNFPRDRERQALNADCLLQKDGDCGGEIHAKIGKSS